MSEVGELRPEIEGTGTRIAFVHPESEPLAQPWFDRYHLHDVLKVSDPSLKHYRAFGLGNMSLFTLVAPSVLARGAGSAMSHGFGAQPAGLLRQLGGVFILHHDRILAEFRHQSSADRPDYLDLVRSGRARDVTLSGQ